MAGRGVFFALDELTVKRLKNLPKDEMVDFIEDEIEEEFFDNKPDYLAETDKAWDAIHRVLTDGYLHWENGEYPLNHVVLGGEVLYGEQEEDNDYIIVLKTPKQVKDIAKAIITFTKETFESGYANIPMEDYDYHLGFEDLQYSLKWFEKIKPFWQKAASENLFVVFTVAL